MIPKLLQQTYAGRRVFVTGDTGFKGSWLVQWLLGLGAEVVGYALAPQTGQDNYVRIGLADCFEHHDGDVRDLEHLQRVMADAAPEIAFHLAAQPLVLESYRDPVGTMNTNVMGTVHFLEAVRHTPSVRAAVNITTDKVYENREWVYGYREVDPLGGHDPYSASKAASEIVTQSYARAFFSGETDCAIATGRSGNVIGAGDWAANRIVPDCIRALQSGEPIEVRNPVAVRPWQHVLEPLCGYLVLGARLLESPARFRGAWNFGPLLATMVPVSELADKMVACWGSGSWRSTATTSTPHEAGLLHLDISRAVNQLGWSPALNLEETVALTIEGYRMDLECEVADRLRAHRESQIRRYVDRLEHADV